MLQVLSNTVLRQQYSVCSIAWTRRWLVPAICVEIEMVPWFEHICLNATKLLDLSSGNLLFGYGEACGFDVDFRILHYSIA